MKLAISNIAWSSEQDIHVYKLMKQYGFKGLEIAPTRIFPERPYDFLSEANRWKKELKDNYGFDVPSMQSIWYGRQEKLFGTFDERKKLIDYTKKAIDFAATIDCRNLVFGCPKNRVIPEGVKPEVGIAFFREIGNFAVSKGTVIGMEANPIIYNTNYINDTNAALELIEQVDSPGFRLNLDVGTMIQNRESVSELEGKVNLINHVHISEPNLKPIKERVLHRELKDILLNDGYEGFVSIEMGRVDDISMIEEKFDYIRGVFR